MITGLASVPGIKFPTFIPAFLTNYHSDLIAKGINATVSHQWKEGFNGWLIKTIIHLDGGVDIPNYFYIRVSGDMFDCKGVNWNEETQDFEPGSIPRNKTGHLKDSPYCPY